MKPERAVWHSLAHAGCSMLLLSGCGGNANRNGSGGESGSGGSGSSINSTSEGSASGGSASSAASSSAGGGGSTGAPPSKTLECGVDPNDTEDVSGLGTAEERREYAGSNGTFVDHCVDGNLIDYACEVLRGDFPMQTGEVIFEEFDCGGRCQDGTCPDPCPFGVMRFDAVDEDGLTVMTNLDNGWSYECELTSDDNFCQSLELGAQLSVVFGPSFHCTSDEVGSLALGTNGTAQCNYDGCTLFP